MKTGSPKEIYAMSGMSVHGLCNLIGQPAQAQSIVDGFNYVVEQKGLKKVHFISGLYAEDEVRRDPDKGKVQGILFQGEPGKPVAVLIAGGGFDGVALIWRASRQPWSCTGGDTVRLCWSTV